MTKNYISHCLMILAFSAIPYIAWATLPVAPLNKEMTSVWKALRTAGYYVPPRDNLPTIVRCDDCLKKYQAAALYFTVPDTIFVPSYFKEEGDLESIMLFRHEVCHAFLEKIHIPHEKQEPICREIELQSH